MKLIFIFLNIFLVSSMQPEKFNSIRMYEVFVSTYSDGDTKIGFQEGWGPSKYTNSYGGDLQGIINNLPKIAEMGFNAIWMTPVFDTKYTESQNKPSTYCKKHSSTGYFAVDYFNIDPHFGTNEKFKELVDTAHKNNLWVILDGVFGHIKGKECGVQTPESSWGYVPTILASSAPDYSKVDYNDNGSSMNYFKEVIMHWMRNYDIDGWRLDVANELSLYPDQNNAVKGNLAKEFVKVVAQATKLNEMDGKQWGVLGYMVGEVFQGSVQSLKEWYGNEEQESFYSYFDFASYYIYLRAFGVQTDGQKSTTFTELKEALNYHTKYYPKWSHPNMFIGNHDILRIGNLIKRRTGVKPTNQIYWNYHLAIQTYQLMYPGPITMYYGEEVGEYLDCFEKDSETGDSTCGGAAEDNMARSNPTPENKLTKYQKEHREKIVKLLQWRAKHPIASCRACKTELVQNQQLKGIVLRHNDNNTVIDSAVKLVYAINLMRTSTTFELKYGDKMVDILTGEEINGQGKLQMKPNTTRIFAVYRPGGENDFPVVAQKSSSFKVFGVLILCLLFVVF